MIEANKKVFASLDQYSSSQGTDLRNAGSARFIRTEGSSDKRLLQRATVAGKLSFSASRHLARLDLDRHSYFCAVGFPHTTAPTGLADDSLTGGILTAALSELGVQPSATAAEIRDIVEFSQMGDPDYDGHEAGAIASLFPPISVFTVRDLSADETWRVFFEVCLTERANSGFWADQPLVETLQELCALDPLKIPYRTLCRSIFDEDKSALFMALYRCIEALYAYTSASDLARALRITNPWTDVAVALEDKLGWYPREEGSLESLTRHASEYDLKMALRALAEEYEDFTAEQLASRAARRIYRLRNTLVHYRPAQHSVDFSAYDWNRLCEAMAGVVCHVYARVFYS